MHILELKKCRLDDYGVYGVCARNEVGEVMHKCEVEIEEEPEPPSFLDPIPDLTIMEYTPLTYKIRVQAQPKPDSIEWFLNEEKTRYGKDWQMMWEEPNLAVLQLPKPETYQAGVIGLACMNKSGLGQIRGNLRILKPLI